MKIELENVGKINKAQIRLDGITVIAGENSTGKSIQGILPNGRTYPI